MKSGLGSLTDAPEFQRMTQALDPQMAAQAVGMDPNSPKFQAIWGAWNNSSVSGQSGQNGQPPAPAAPVVPPTDPNAVPQRAAAIVNPPQQQAYDLAGAGAPGYALNLSVQNGVAEQMGDPYDIQEAGNGAPVGPPPQNIASVIEQLGFKRKQLQTA